MSKGILFQLEEKETYVRAFYRAKTEEGGKKKKETTIREKMGNRRNEF